MFCRPVHRRLISLCMPRRTRRWCSRDCAADLSSWLFIQPVCGDQMALYNEVLPEFQRFNAELLGISVDGVWCHAAFSRDRKLHFPLLADFEPKGAVAKLYGAFRDGEGIAERALFVIDKNGIIRWSYCSPIAVNPGADGILEALENLPK